MFDKGEGHGVATSLAAADRTRPVTTDLYVDAAVRDRRAVDQRRTVNDLVTSQRSS
jgi:hypothetical protein